MPDEAVELDKGARIEELDEPFACEQLPLLALALDRLVGAGVLRFVAQLLELLELRLCRVVARVVGRRHRVEPNQARSSSIARAAPVRCQARDGSKTVTFRETVRRTCRLRPGLIIGPCRSGSTT